MRGAYIVAEHIDGGGGSVIIEGLKKYFKEQNQEVLDITELWGPHSSSNIDNLLTDIYGKEIITETKDKKTGDIEWYANKVPEFNKIKEYYEKKQQQLPNTIIICEPTFAEYGLPIRKEITNSEQGLKYKALDAAKAYSEDRKNLLNKLIIPAREHGVNIISDRSVISSLAYQSTEEDGELDITAIISLEGNKLALDNAPDLAIISDLSVETALERLASRTKKDNCKYEKKNFLEKVQRKYLSKPFLHLLEGFGTKVTYLQVDNPRKPSDTIEGAKMIAKDFLNEKLSTRYLYNEWPSKI
ncbi:hypothetical protein KY330_03210 [Candidatus Woesearchaeota archaeon]|nr:hypothetical protein [Candidatus Woesearchaeota archaeon]